MLVLPINSDPQAGKCPDAGLHWSVLIARRPMMVDSCSERSAAAELHDSLPRVSPIAFKAACAVLRRLTDSGRWRSLPRTPQPRARGLQRDDYQCGLFCLLMMHE